MLSDGASSVRVTGRSLRQIIDMGQQLEQRIGFTSSPPPGPPTAAPTVDVLSIPTVHVSRPDPVPFTFEGYPKVPVDAPLTTRAAGVRHKKEKLLIPPMHESCLMQTSTLLKDCHREDRANAFEFYDHAISDGEQDSLARHVWKMLLSMSRGAPEGPPLMIYLLSGARKWFEQDFKSLLKKRAKSDYTDHKTGLEMDATHLYVSFVRAQQSNFYFDLSSADKIEPVKFKWQVVYIALRAGDFEAAAKLAEDVAFPPGTSHTPKELLATWRTTGGRLPLHYIGELITLCHNLLSAAPNLSIDSHYLIRTLGFLCGHVGTVERLLKKTGTSWDSVEEYLWFLLGCVRHLPPQNGRGVFGLESLQRKIKDYLQYLEGRREQNAMILITSLLCSLQFKAALKYMLGLPDSQMWYVHGVHIAVALECMDMLDLGGARDEKAFSRRQVSQVISQYASVFRQTNNDVHFQYIFFANKLASDTPQSMEEAMLENIVDYIIQDQRQGLELSAESVQTIQTYGACMRYPRRLFSDVAKCLKDKGYLEHAFKCYHAGQYVREALETLNELVSSKLGNMFSEKLTDHGERFRKNRQHVAVLLDLFDSIYKRWLQDVHTEAAALRSLHESSNAFKQVFRMLDAYEKNDFHDVIDRFEKLPYIPKSDSDLESFAERLKGGYSAHLGILHKLIGLFCKTLKILATTQQGGRQRENRGPQLALFQRWIQFLPQPYGFNGHISRELAQASSELFTI